MLIGDMRVSNADRSQVTDLRRDAPVEASVGADPLNEDRAARKRDGRPGLDACLRALRERDTVVVWIFDRLDRNLKYLVEVVQALDGRDTGLKVLPGQAASVDTTTASSAAFAKFEWERIVEHTVAGLAAARARGRHGGAALKITLARLRLAQTATGKPQMKIAELCAEFGITRQPRYRYVTPGGAELLARRMGR